VLSDLAQQHARSDQRRSWRAFVDATLVQFVLFPATVGIVLCQGFIWLKPAAVWAAVWEHFALQLAGAALVTALLALLLRRWIWAGVLVALAATHALPVLPSWGDDNVAARPERLRVVSANLYYFATDEAATIAMLRNSGADIIGLVEVTPAWQKAVGTLADIYPYRVDCYSVAPDCENILLSRLPLSNPRAGRLETDAPMLVAGDLQWQGRPMTVAATHITWPLSPAMNERTGLVSNVDDVPLLVGSLPATRQVEQAEALARVLARLPADLVLMGDMNSTPWSRMQRALRAATGLENAAGWRLSWPSWLPAFLRLPIDHVLARGDLVVTSFVAGPKTDSDHLPVIAEIGWRQ